MRHSALIHGRCNVVVKLLSSLSLSLELFVVDVQPGFVDNICFLPCTLPLCMNICLVGQWFFFPLDVYLLIFTMMQGISLSAGHAMMDRVRNFLTTHTDMNVNLCVMIVQSFFMRRVHGGREEKIKTPLCDPVYFV